MSDVRKNSPNRNFQKNGNGNNDAVKKFYFGNGQEKTRQNGQNFIVGSLCYDDIMNIPKEYLVEAKNGKRYFKVVVNPFYEGVNQYGNTHSFQVDTFKPETNDVNGEYQKSYQKNQNPKPTNNNYIKDSNYSKSLNNYSRQQKDLGLE